MYLHKKNKLVKNARWWNKEEVGDIFLKSKLLQARIKLLQTKEAEGGLSSEEERVLNSAKREL